MSSIKPSHLSGTQDLLSTFGLSTVYAQHVRPYLSSSLFTATRQSTPVIDDIKGKKATPDAEGLVPAAAGGAAISKASMKKHYSHYIVDVPGQNRLAKDRHLQDLLLDPDPPDSVKFIPLEAQTIRDAFSLEVGELEDFDPTVWRADATEERKKRKKRMRDEAQNMAPAVTVGVPSPAPTAGQTGQGNATKRRKVGT